MPAAASRGALAACTRALVASKARSIRGVGLDPVDPLGGRLHPQLGARARPSRPGRCRPAPQLQRGRRAACHQVGADVAGPDDHARQGSVEPERSPLDRISVMGCPSVTTRPTGRSQSNSARTRPRGQRDGGVQGPGHHHVPGLEGRAERVQGVGQPGDRVQRVAEGGRAAPVGPARRCGSWPPRPAAGRPGRGGPGGSTGRWRHWRQVGDRVGQPDAPVRDRESMISTAATARRRPRTSRAVQWGRPGGLEHDAISASTLGWISRPGRPTPSGGPGGQHRAVVGLVDAQLGLHRPAGQAELVADDVALPSAWSS